MNWKEYERQQSEHNLRHYMGFSWIAWGNPQKTCHYHLWAKIRI